MPKKESLKDLARHKSSLCLYLSARHIKSSQETLLEFYPPETKVIVGYRVSWDDGWTSLIELRDMEKFTKRKDLLELQSLLLVLLSIPIQKGLIFIIHFTSTFLEINKLIKLID